MVGLLRLVLIFAIIYYSFKLVSKYLVPLLFPSANQHNFSNKRGPKEGEIHVKHDPDQKKKIHKDIGEYVDFKEIKEEE